MLYFTTNHEVQSRKSKMHHRKLQVSVVFPVEQLNNGFFFLPIKDSIREELSK